MRIGIECGGTFTDVIAADDDGAVTATAKVFSTPDDPSRSVAAGLAELPADLLPGASLFHGSTVATNAVLERQGAVVALVTTRGFRDVVFLQRQDRSSMYDLTYVKPRPLVDRERVIEIAERIDAAGSVVLELEDDAIAQTVARLRELAPTAIAVSLLHSYANPVHEERLAAALRAGLPDIPVSVSHEVAREFREYERTTTTIVDAFIRPMVAGYLGRLRGVANEAGIASIGVMQSNGGIVPPESVVARPVTMLMSGPAAGVSGAVTVGQRVGVDEIVTMDMGGTSTDVAFVRDGVPDLASETVIDGLPLRVPLVDIHTVGAGGGSIIGVDSGGLLTVGPRSAGAAPGPACYGRGGTLPTITDANLIIGAMPREVLLAGRFPLDYEAARAAFTPLADRLGRTVEQVAADAVAIANTTMAGAIREVSLERGHEVAHATLIAYGGAGSLHAADVADQLGMTSVLVPPHSGITSAYGLLTSRFQRDFSRTWFRDDVEQLAHDALREQLAQMRAASLDELARQGLEVSAAEATWLADLRYRGQGFELATPFDVDEALSEIVARFHRLHERQFGHASPGRAVQLVTLRLRIALPAPPSQGVARTTGDGRRTTISVTLDGVARDAVLTDRSGIGDVLNGPAVVTDTTSTTFVPPGWTARLDEHGDIRLDRSIA